MPRGRKRMPPTAPDHPRALPHSSRRKDHLYGRYPPFVARGRPTTLARPPLRTPLTALCSGYHSLPPRAYARGAAAFFPACAKEKGCAPRGPRVAHGFVVPARPDTGGHRSAGHDRWAVSAALGPPPDGVRAPRRAVRPGRSRRCGQCGSDPARLRRSGPCAGGGCARPPCGVRHGCPAPTPRPAAVRG